MTTKLPLRHNEPDEIQGQPAPFGARLRELRLRRGWTFQEPAARGSLTKPFLSRLESGGRQASMAAALTPARIFDDSLASLFDSPVVETPCVLVRAGDAMERSARGLKNAPLSNAGRFFNLQPLRRAIPVVGLLPLEQRRTSNPASTQRRLAQRGAHRRWGAIKPQLKK
jgi:transcriptional regulator with XRE-family HTH domain